MTYDWRVRQAFNYETPVATNLAAVFIDDDSIKLINSGLSYSWPWPRQLHGRLINRLHRNGAKAIAFDILFDQLHPRSDATDVVFKNGDRIGSDDYFAAQLSKAGAVALATFGDSNDRGEWTALMPAELFRTNAWIVGHATSETDSDGVLRRARPFRDDPHYGRIWHLGIAMAAPSLGLDLAKTEVRSDRIIFHGTNSIQRIVPVDRDGMFYVNWSLKWNDKRITKESFEEAAGLVTPSSSFTPIDWTDKLVFVGSIGAGNNIADFGTTALARDTFLISKHWNVANSMLTGQFIQPIPTALGLLLILGLGLIALLVTLKLKAPWASILIVLTAASYVLLTLFLYVEYRLWLPIVTPVMGGLILTHIGLVVYQGFYEQREKRRVKAVFAKVVSPEVVEELLEAETLNLGGANRRMTVMFSDVRGFTAMTDIQQDRAESFVRSQNLNNPEAEIYRNQQAAEVLATVNLYLATIADQVKHHKGTLDKYIGDCVMAFWGAPLPNEQHAVNCVRAAIDAQWSIHRLNTTRALENKRREAENHDRKLKNRPVLPLLPILSLGTGINTGNVIVGLMGSKHHIFNYTVFGREINLASRLETVSGSGRIVIGEATYLDLVKFAPDLAKICVELSPVNVKGIRTELCIYEVPWKSCRTIVPISEGEIDQAIPGQGLINPDDVKPQNAKSRVF